MHRDLRQIDESPRWDSRVPAESYVRLVSGLLVPRTGTNRADRTPGRVRAEHRSAVCAERFRSAYRDNIQSIRCHVSRDWDPRSQYQWPVPSALASSSLLSSCSGAYPYHHPSPPSRTPPLLRGVCVCVCFFLPCTDPTSVHHEHKNETKTTNTKKKGGTYKKKPHIHTHIHTRSMFCRCVTAKNIACGNRALPEHTTCRVHLRKEEGRRPVCSAYTSKGHPCLYFAQHGSLTCGIHARRPILPALTTTVVMPLPSFRVAWSRGDMTQAERDIFRELTETCTTRAELESRLVTVHEDHLGDQPPGDQPPGDQPGMVSEFILTVTCVDTPETNTRWHHETAQAQDLGGDLAIGPRITSLFDCNSYGFLLMQRVHEVTVLPNAVRLRTVDHGYIRDVPERLPSTTQQAFIALLHNLTTAGYIQMDNQLANLGVVLPSKRPCLCNFEHLQARTFATPWEHNLAVAFSLAQLVEHCTVHSLHATENHFSATLTTLLYHLGFVPPSTRPTRRPLPGHHLLYPHINVQPYSTARLTTFITWARERSVSEHNVDLVVGLWAYIQLLGLPLETRGKNKYRTLVYTIRQGQWTTALYPVSQ